MIRCAPIVTLLIACAIEAQAQEAGPEPQAAPPAAAEAEADETALVETDETVLAAVERERPAVDHLELDPTSIIGNRELPKVMVVVPWKRAELGDLEGRPANSLVNEVLEPVDRDVFRRELRYFDALTAKPGT